MKLFNLVPTLLFPLLCLLAKTNYVLSAEEDWKSWECKDLIFDECQLDVVEGEVPVRGITVRYWKYSRSANITIPKNTETLPLSPIIFINGGASLPHNYALPLKKQACRGRDIIFYDQAGCGKSLIPNAPVDEHTFALTYRWLLDISYYATEELPALISHLGYKKFHIIGHSWGSMIAQVFALDGPKKEVKGIQSLTLSGPISDANLFAQAQWDPKHGSISTLPPFMQERIHALQGARQFDSVEYQAIVDTYWSSFLVRTQPAPDCVTESFSGLNTNIYHGIFGKDEFSIGGTIKDFNITSRIHKIKLPVLLTSGQYDSVRPQVVDTIQQELKSVERALFFKSAHLSMIDEPDRMNEVIQDFLDRVEQSIVRDKKFKTKKSSDSFLSSDSLSATYGEEKYQSRFSSAALIVSTFMAFVLGVVVGVRATWVNQQDMYQPIVQTAF